MLLGIKRMDINICFSSLVVKDWLGYTNRMYSNRDHLKAAIDWIKLAQDVCVDRGVSAGYYYGIGWKASYPEITGYIIPTMFNYYHFANDDDCKKRAIEMSNFLVDVQLDNGAFQSGLIGAPPIPEVFNTGQCLQGLVRSYKETNRDQYLESAIKAGDWLLSVQDEDGSWNHCSYYGVPHTYYSRVAWPLLELYAFVRDQKYKSAAVKNIEWACTNCNEQGWYKNCGFGHSSYGSSMLNPLTHTIAYTAEGILECGIALSDNRFIQTATRTMNGLLRKFETDGCLKGTYDENWESHDSYRCLTGDAQIALIWLRLFESTKDKVYKSGAVKLNNFLKTTQNVNLYGKHLSGGIKGSQPIYGKYEWLGYPTWATKFFSDSLLLLENMKE